MKSRSETACRWLLVLGGLCGYGLGLALPATREYAFFGAGLLGMWLGMILALPSADGKRNPYSIILSLLVLLLAARVGARIWDATVSSGVLFRIFPATHCLKLSAGRGPECSFYWLAFAALGWCCGVTVAATRKRRMEAIPFGAALSVVIVAGLPWAAVALAALVAPPDYSSDWLEHILFFEIILILLLDAALLGAAGFRRQPRLHRSWCILGATVLTAVGIWGGAEIYFQSEVRQLRRLHPYRPTVLTPEEEHTVRLFRQAYEAKEAYEQFLRASVGSPQRFGVPDPQPVPPILGSGKWRLQPNQYRNPLTSGPEPITEEYKQKVLAMDATKECNAFFDALEQFLNEKQLVTEPAAANPTGQLVRTQINSMARWLIGRAQLRHYTGDPAGTIHYLDLAFRMGKVWPGDHNQAGQTDLLYLDRIALSAILSLGPDGPEYADRYRDWLKRARMRRYGPPDQSQALAADWDDVLAGGFPGQHQKPSPGLAGWFLNPLFLQTQMREFRDSERAREAFTTTRRQLKRGIPWPETAAAALPKNDRNEIRDMLAGKARLQTALALKLYRSLYGVYPKSLAQLVPEFLECLPAMPETGQPAFYCPSGDGFVLGDGFTLSNGPAQPPLRPGANY